MYLKKGYFAEQGPHPADDIGQGYLTATYPVDDLPKEILKLAESDPRLLEDFETDEDLLDAIEEENLPESFKMFRNNEVGVGAEGEVGYKGFGLDIAYSSERSVAVVAYTGPGLPTVVRRYECKSVEEAVASWQLEWAEPLILSEGGR